MSSVRLSAAPSSVEPEHHDRLSTGIAGEGLLHSLHADPIEMQQAVCEAINGLIRDGQAEISRLDALLALERQAQPVTDLLLTQYVEDDGHIGSFEWKAWHSALRISQSFCQAYEYFLQRIPTTTGDDRTNHETLVRVRLFHHRKVEFLLRFLRYKKRSPDLWRRLHQMYRLAHQRDVRNRLDGTRKVDGERRTTGELQQQYLQILLLEAMNSGRFSPREALWAHRWFARWCGAPGVQLSQLDGEGHERKGFAVDLGGTEGLKRPSAVEGDLAADNLLYFDSSPLIAMIEQEKASLWDSARLPSRVTPAERAGQLALLNKLAILFAPNPVDIERRAERKPVALAVQAIVGFRYIVDELCRTGPPTFATAGNAGPTTLRITGVFDGIPQVWQVKDRSDSGCRMRAQIDSLNVIPGSLIAVRDSETAPWIVSVVRWFRRLMVDYVEIGVEYLGREPRFVKLVTGCDRDLSAGEAPPLASRCFAALYLPPSAEYPTMPIKTLLLPAHDFRTDSDVTLLSSSATYRMRLNEPIQQQFEYVWTSFSLIDDAAQLGAPAMSQPG
jgi:hypothetical protein